MWSNAAASVVVPITTSKQSIVLCRMELERQIAEREESIVNEDTVMTAVERKINAHVLSKAIAASPACCVCGQCADCCAWQQTRSKLGSSRRSR